MHDLPRRLRRLATTGLTGVVAATSLLIAVPGVAGADDSATGTCADPGFAVTGGTFEWGVRDSWRTYLQGPVAKGGWNLSGVSYRAPAFVFTPTGGGAALDGKGRGVVPLRGSVTFHGHGGALDMTLSDVALVIDGGSAGIRADYVTYDSDFQSTGTKGTKRTANDVVIARIDLSRAAAPAAGNVSLAGTTTLTTAGAKLFAQYGSGAAMDPTGGSLRLTATCGGSGSGGGGGGGTATGGMGGLLAGVNDTFSEVNTLLGNTTELFDASEQLRDRLRGGEEQPGATGEGGGGGGSATDVSTDWADGDVGSEPTLDENLAGPAAGTPAAEAPVAVPAAAPASTGGAGGEMCTAEGSRGVTQAQAQWGVRQSFLNYLSGGIAKGGWELSGVGHDNGRFSFTGASGAVDPQAKSGSILFPGGIRFTGHGGTLDTRFTNLEIQFSGDSGALVVNASANSTEGQARDFGRVTLGALNFSSLQVSDSQVGGTAEVTLTEAGSRAFGDFYPAGDRLDPITFRAALGGAGNCADGQGGSASATAAGGASGDTVDTTADLFAAEDDAASTGEDLFGDDATAPGTQAGGEDNQFRIRSAAGDSDTDRDRLVTLVLLTVAAFVVGGASLSSFGRHNPTVGQ